MAKINEKCINCGTCASIALGIFGFDNYSKMTVIKQPETDQEKADYEIAKASCPAEAIED